VSSPAAAPAGGPPAGRHGDEITAVPVRRPGRWVAAVVLLVLAANLVYSLASNPRLDWETTWNYLFDTRILDGLWITIELTVIAMVVGVALGILLAVMRLSDNPLISGISSLYIWFFRGTPILVQLLIWYYIATIYPDISIGIPFGGPDLVSADSNSLITKFSAALLGLALNEAAYMAEIVRAGIESVDEGQSEAGQALGMTRSQTLRRIVLPQAMRVIVPPTGNEAINMLKTTSLVSVITLADLTYAAQLIYSNNLQQIPLLMVVCFWYLLLTTVMSIGQYYIERYYARGSSRRLPPTPAQRLRARFGGASRGGVSA
jgi:polar amino acid transport system permease protein